MHAMKLRVQALQATRRRSRAAHAERWHWSEGSHTNVGSLWEGRTTTQVMLGVSLRARWDATVVIVIMTLRQSFRVRGGRCVYSCVLHVASCNEMCLSQ